MTEYDRGRAEALAEAAKLLQHYGDVVKNHGAIPVDPYEAVREAVSDLVAALRALSTSPGEHVLVPAPKPIAEAPRELVDGPTLVWLSHGPSPELRTCIDGAWWHRMAEEAKQRGDTFYITHYWQLSNLPDRRAMLSAKE